MQNQIFKEQI